MPDAETIPSCQTGVKRKYAICATKAAAYVAALACIIVFSALMWLAQKPRQLDFLMPYMEKRLQLVADDAVLAYESATISWKGWGEPVTLDVKHLRASMDGKQSQIYLPELSIGIKLTTLLPGKLRLADMYINRPALFLYRGSEGNLLFSTPETTADSAIEAEMPDTNANSAQGDAFSGAALAALLTLNTDKVSVDSVVIDDADITLGDALNGKFWRVPHADIRLIARRNGVGGVIDLPVIKGEERSALHFVLDADVKTHRISAALQLEQFNPSFLSEWDESLARLEQNTTPLTGTASVILNLKGEVEGGNISMDIGKGLLSIPEVFESSLPIESGHVEAKVLPAFEGLNIERLQLTTKDVKHIEASGTWMRGEGSNPPDSAGWHLKMQANVEALNVNALSQYWVLPLVPHIRSWVLEHIRDGVVPKASIQVDIKESQLPLRPWPEEVLTAEVYAEGVTVHYLGELPEVRNVRGTVKFTGKSMTIEADKGTVLSDSQLLKAHLILPDMSQRPADMHIELDVDASAPDVVAYLQHDPLPKLEALNLKPENVGGRAKGTLVFDFPLREPEPDEVTLRYNINAHFTEGTAAQLLKRYDITAMDADFHLSNDAIRLKGAMALFDVPATINMDGHYMAGRGFAGAYAIDMQMPDAKLTQFGLPEWHGVTGDLGLNAVFTYPEKALPTMRYHLDAKDAALDWPWLSYQKELGMPAVADVELIEGNTQFDIIALSALGDRLRVEGAGAASKDLSIFHRFDIKDAVIGETEASVNVLYDQAYHIDVHGKKVDVSGLRAAASDKKKSQTHNPPSADGVAANDSSINTAFSLKLKTPHLRIDDEDGNYLKNVNAFVQCSDVCSDIKLQSQLPNDDPLSVKLTTDLAARTLLVETPNGGELIKTLGIVTNIEGGKFMLSAEFDDNKPSHPMTGRILMEKHNIRKAPVLAKILTLASLSGILNGLNGNGIVFDKMMIPFTYEDGIVYFKDARTVGASLGITAKGMVNTSDSVLDIEGTVVPAYTLNSMLGKVPLIGKALVGGEGEGIFATNYSVKGPYTDAKVTVNPLSLLTPGFLRGIFDVGESEKGVKPETPQP